MRWIPAHAGYTSVLVVLLAALQQGGCSGVFELRLKSFVNDYGKDSVGQCCSGEPPAPGSGLCSGPCRTRFRVCLKHYQAQIDTTSPCTFGDCDDARAGREQRPPEWGQLRQPDPLPV
uniref:Notch ligand N-terminal domain-containing protein n=1 Tax=Timema shepardi TaxID=629360 RepID=A0A7R9FW84_TIMSH|nr:unnamed protein product [Timema shepardi]